MKNSSIFRFAIFATALLASGSYLTQNVRADNGVLSVTQISAIQTFGSADGNFADGWKWTFNVTVPTGQNALQMKFADWTSTNGTIPAANNLQFYSSQSTNAFDESHAIPITASGTYSASMYLNPSGDLDPNTAGQQIQITLEARIPVGSSGGSYSTSYGINTSVNLNPVPLGSNPPIISNVQTTNVGANSATITWATNENGDSEVYYGTSSGNYTLLVSNSNTVSSGNVFTHSVTISNLSASTTYYFKAATLDNSGDEGVSDEGSFTTLAASIGNVTGSATGNLIISTGVTNQEIGSYTLTASPVEGVTISNLSIQPNVDGFQNLKVLVNGVQFGAVQNLATSGTVYTFSGVPFAIPASGTAAVNVYVDNATSTTSSATTLTGISGTGATSGGVISLASAVQGQSLSLPVLMVSLNTALGNQNISAGVTNQRIGSYTFHGASAEGVNVNSVSVQADGQYFQNLHLMVNGVQFGTTQGIVSSGTTYTFSGSPFSVSAGNTVNVDMYADTLSSGIGTISPASKLTGCSAIGQVSSNSFNCSSVSGQNIGFALPAQITVTADSTQPPSGQIVMGSTGNALGIYRFTETSNIENVKVTDLQIVDRVASTNSIKSAFSNLQIWNGSTLLGTAGAPVADAAGTGYIYAFHLSTPIIIPQANSVSITLKGDAATYSSQGATDDANYQFAVATTTDSTNSTSGQTVIALGATSNKTAIVSLSNANGNSQTVLRSTLNVTTAPLGGSSHSKSNVDNLGTITFTANAAGPILLNSTTITLSGSAATSTLGSLQLIDQNGLDVVAAGEAASTTLSTTNKQWIFTNGFQINGGNSYTFIVRVNSLLAPQQPNVAQSLGAVIQNNTDVGYTDGVDASATPGLNLPTAVVPLTINSVTYPVGN